MDGKPPPVKKPHSLAGYLEALSRPVFQAGMSWRVIDAKWDGIREAFAGFDPDTVADFGAADVERLLCDQRVIRRRPKIESTVDNAQAMIELDAEYHGFRKYLRSHDGYEPTVANLKCQFRFIGDSGAYHFLYVVGEQVPPHEQWFGAQQGASRRPTRSGRPKSASRKPSPGAAKVGGMRRSTSRA